MENRHKGDYTEYKAVTYLMENGYEVFKNVSSKGPVDIIAFKEGILIYIDVKTVPSNTVPYLRCTPKQIKLGVKILGYCSKTKTFKFMDTIAVKPPSKWEQALKYKEKIKELRLVGYKLKEISNLLNLPLYIVSKLSVSLFLKKCKNKSWPRT